jgi:hypothetical protein
LRLEIHLVEGRACEMPRDCGAMEPGEGVREVVTASGWEGEKRRIWGDFVVVTGQFRTWISGRIGDGMPGRFCGGGVWEGGGWGVPGNRGCWECVTMEVIAGHGNGCFLDGFGR